MVYEVAIAEAMASREALDWLKNAGFDRVLLESDVLSGPFYIQ